MNNELISKIKIKTEKDNRRKPTEENSHAQD